MINSKQRAYLRAMANGIDAIFQIGKGGVSDEICLQLSNALDARELIKVKVLDNSGLDTKEIANAIADEIGADCVGTSGRTFCLYKESTKKKKIELP